MDSNPIGIKVHQLSRPINDLDTLALQLPDSFGRVYVGEQFPIVLACAYTDPSIALRSVTASVSTPPGLNPIEIRLAQRASQKFAYIALGKTEIRSAGLHALTITVQYTVGDDTTTKSMRKVYKFTAQHCISITTSVVPSRANSYFVLTRVENVLDTGMPLSIDCVDLTHDHRSTEPGALTAAPVVLPESKIPTEKVMLMPGSVYQYIHEAVPSSDGCLGKVVSGWHRDHLGERGWLTSPDIYV
ncbi:hypothetical protein CANCADRAFT_106918 [Tortispora caseinolytica NRRL Y-17796]|uniref:Trafficking protein particle complex subunit 13 N-terminal domain-containing protein n=1 Tax=Tortispora caseinolytica NRRL Y-17796 TaxID=767744 RepID=A0A1E4TFD1_9ASCO|nr:hypothetical protein CANCADRAFT_106918 [Tortispora caseinolytica NRRL Y-17796]